MKLDLSNLKAGELKTGLSLMKEVNNYGYEAYLVGGCVRDMILGEEVSDVDIATNMPMDKIKEHFQAYSYGGGEKHGTLIVHFEDFDFELTQFRIESDYSDSRRPDSVEFTDNFFEDVLRRDFTINALGMDSYGNVIDHVGGVKDLEDGIIRCVGDAEERFSEDKLRTIRAVRFAVRFGFSLEKKTQEALKVHVVGLHENISVERIVMEIEKVYNYGKIYDYYVLLMYLRCHQDVFFKLDSGVISSLQYIDHKLHTLSTFWAVIFKYRHYLDKYYDDYDTDQLDLFVRRYKLPNTIKNTIKYINTDFNEDRVVELYNMLTKGNYEERFNATVLMHPERHSEDFLRNITMNDHHVEWVNKILELKPIMDSVGDINRALLDAGIPPSAELGKKQQELVTYLAETKYRGGEIPTDIYKFTYENHDKV